MESHEKVVNGEGAELHADLNDSMEMRERTGKPI